MTKREDRRVLERRATDNGKLEANLMWSGIKGGGNVRGRRKKRSEGRR